MLYVVLVISAVVLLLWPRSVEGFEFTFKIKGWKLLLIPLLIEKIRDLRTDTHVPMTTAPPVPVLPSLPEVPVLPEEQASAEESVNSNS